jgi:hypothetical protein
VLATANAPTAIRLSATVATILAVSSGPASATVPEVPIEMVVTGANGSTHGQLWNIDPAHDW